MERAGAHAKIVDETTAAGEQRGILDAWNGLAGNVRTGPGSAIAWIAPSDIFDCPLVANIFVSGLLVHDNKDQSLRRQDVLAQEIMNLIRNTMRAEYKHIMQHKQGACKCGIRLKARVD